MAPKQDAEVKVPIIQPKHNLSVCHGQDWKETEVVNVYLYVFFDARVSGQTVR